MHTFSGHVEPLSMESQGGVEHTGWATKNDPLLGGDISSTVAPPDRDRVANERRH